MVANVQALSCPQCGARLHRKHVSCDHCGASVKFSSDRQAFDTVGLMCPSCDAGNGLQDRHCGSCGEVLLQNCNSPNCHQVNSIWRKFCSKCGSDLDYTRSKIEKENEEEAKQKIQYYEMSVASVGQSIDGARARAVTVRSLILLVGGLLFLGSLVSDAWPLALLWALVFGTWWKFYESAEVKNLEMALRLHEADLQRAKNKLNGLNAGV